MSSNIRKNEREALDNPPHDAENRTTPSWFSQTYRNEESGFLVDQYRRQQDEPVSARLPDSEAYELYRRRMMDRLREQNETVDSRSAVPPMPPRPMMSNDDISKRDQHFDRKRNGIHGRAHPNAGKVSSIIVAGIFAVVAGGSIGFALTRYDDIAKSTANLFHQSKDLLPVKTTPVLVANQKTTIPKKPINIATLKVADVSGSLNSIIPLALQADPAYATQELALQISGLPKSAYLSKGTRTSDTTWLLKDGEETGLNLFVPNSDTAKFDVSVAAIETKTGELAAPVKEMTVALDDASLQISPASAPPETSTLKMDQPDLASAIPTPEPIAVVKPALSAEVSGLMQKGDSLFKSGDLVIARQFYARAFEMGAADGATGVARTYDPAIYKQMDVNGIVPDAELAAQWYDKAKFAGATSPPVASLP